MHLGRRVVLLTSSLLFLQAPPPLSAQTVIPVYYQVIVPADEFGSLAFLKEVVEGLSSARLFCGEIEESSYRIDCLSDRVGKVADRIPAGTDYSEVRRVLKGVSQDMKSLVHANSDDAKPRLRAERPQAKNGNVTRTLGAVQKRAESQVNRQAREILDSAVTTLLRSPEHSRGMRNQYAQIARALGSNKVLLRA